MKALTYDLCQAKLQGFNEALRVLRGTKLEEGEDESTA